MAARTPRGGACAAKTGIPEPYRVKYWQIGNEIGGETYDASVKAFAEAMRQADPAIKILSSFPSGETLKLGGGYLDYLARIITMPATWSRRSAASRIFGIRSLNTRAARMCVWP